jgi:hypothetical protein
MNDAPLVLPMPIDDIDHIAVAFGRSVRPFIHSGIIYRDDRDSLLFLDLDLKGDISSDSLEAKRATRFAWTIPIGVSGITLEQIASLCQYLAEIKPRVPYGFKYTPSVFRTEAGSIQFSTSGDSFGLTCATFVLCVFESHNVRLLKENEWDCRVDDENWQSAVYELMRNNGETFGIPQTEIDRNQGDIPCIRFRPQEVIAACRSREIPLGFHEAELLGNECLASLNAMHSVLGGVW